MLEIFLVIFFAIGFAYLAWRNMVLAISFLIFALPTYLLRFELFNLPMTILEVMILALFLVFLLKRFVRRDKSFRGKIGLDGLRFSNYKILILALVIVVTIAAIISTNVFGAWGAWKAYFIEPILFFLVFINTIKTKQDLEKVFLGLGLSALVVSAFAIYQKITGAFIFNEEWFNPSTRRVTSFFGYPNALGLYLAPIVVFFCGKFWLFFAEILKKYKTEKNRQKSLWRKSVEFFRRIFHCKKDNARRQEKIQDAVKLFLYFLIIVTGLLAIYFAQSEGAYLGAAAGVIFLGLIIKKLRVATLIFLFGAIIIFSLCPTINGWFAEKISFADFSGKIRVIIGQETIQMLKAEPFWGAGLANFQSGIAPYHHASRVFEIFLYPHQLILNFWSEIGIFGLLIFILLLAKYFSNYLKVKAVNRSFYQVLICVMIAILFHGLVDVQYFKNDLSVLFWFWFGLSWLMIKGKVEMKSAKQFNLN